MLTLLLWGIIGGLLGWLSSVIMRLSARSAMVQNIIIGSVSALLFGFLGRGLGLYGSAETAGFGLVSLGTIIILAIVNLLRRREERPLIPPWRPADRRSQARPIGDLGGQRPGTGSPPPVHIFLSYRRDDTGGYAVGLSDRLRYRFGREYVFMDIDTIELGLDFVEAIDRAVGSCDVLLALIGPEWLQSTDAQGRRRLDNPTDVVRLEIATALARNIRVIPVLVDSARMPSAEELPAPLQPLARRNALEISNTRWQFDVDRLIEAIERNGRRSPNSP
jgi:uncharacterized membrane protein YeaQ/YmgE (transglycosylase-associated protein family)